MSGIFDANDADELSLAMSRVAQECGFSTFMAGAEIPNELGEPQHAIASGYPEQWQLTYAQRNYQMLDPTVSHCQQSTAPLVWSESCFRKAQAMEVLEEARSYGISYGISVSVHERAGVKSMVSLVRDQPLKEGLERQHMLGAAKTLSGIVHFSMTRIAANSIRERWSPHLTHQELECMKWTSRGKTTWEVSRIMGLAEPTVVFHMKNAMRRLKATNRTQALAIAIRLGLIN